MMINSRVSLIYVLNEIPRPTLPLPRRVEGNEIARGGQTGRMVTTFGWDALRDLAGFRAPNGCAISFYVNLDPALTPTAGDLATRVNSLLSELGRQVNGDTPPERRKHLRAAADRIKAYFDSELDRDGAHGVAVFASSAEELWRPVLLSDPVEDTLKVGTELYIAPLVPHLGR